MRSGLIGKHQQLYHGLSGWPFVMILKASHRLRHSRRHRVLVEAMNHLSHVIGRANSAQDLKKRPASKACKSKEQSI